MTTLLLAHMANITIMLHCATNWILFYRWPHYHRRRCSNHATSITQLNDFVRHRSICTGRHSADNYTVQFEKTEANLLHKVWTHTDQRLLAIDMLKVSEVHLTRSHFCVQMLKYDVKSLYADKFSSPIRISHQKVALNGKQLSEYMIYSVEQLFGG
jgi:hypothetical protein